MSDLTIVRTVAELRAAGGGSTLALVPTMGALHAGHVALVERARAEAERVAVSIFVNPTQFAPGEDFSAYPRTEAADIERLGEAGADIAYIPDVTAMYAPGFAMEIVPGGPAVAGLEDVSRPTHFRGVATVVAKLLLQSRADVAVFGEKDFQQLRVVSQVVADLDIPARIVGHETAREPDGLALSSRNRYLSADERARAPALYATLRTAADAIRQGEGAPPVLADSLQRLRHAGFKPDYFELRDAETLAAAPAPDRPRRLLTAARLGRTRLIDNVAV